VVAVGMDRRSRLGHRGEADVVFVHDREVEPKFVAAGGGVERHVQ